MSLLNFLEQNIKDIKTYSPEKISNDVLRDDFRIVIAWYTEAKKGNFKAYSLDEIISLAKKIFSEVIKRGHKLTFKSPSYKELALKVLSQIAKEPFNLPIHLAKAIYSGKKTIHISSKKVKPNTCCVLTAENKAFGYLTLSEPYAIDLEEFDKLKSKHLIKEEERVNWWGDKNKLYAQDILWFLPLEKVNKTEDNEVTDIPSFELVSSNYLVFLGTGPTQPIPRDGKTNPRLDEDAKKPGSKSKRRRSSIYIFLNGLGYLIDASPDYLEQKETFNIKKIDFVLISHAHRDASEGLKEVLKDFPEALVVCEKVTALKIKERDKVDIPNFLPISPYKSYRIGDLKILPLRVEHSIQEGFPTVVYLLEFPNKRTILYAEDFDMMPKKTLDLAKNVDIAILDAAMWIGYQIRGHQNVETALKYAKELNPKVAIFTQAGYTYPPHNEAVEEIKELARTQVEFPVVLAYDGLKINLDKKEAFESLEDFFNAHELILEEMLARNLKHTSKDKLDKIKLELNEYKDILKIFQNTQDIMLIPQFVSIGGSAVSSKDFGDVDFIVRVGKAETFKEGVMTALAFQLRNIFKEAKSSTFHHLVESPFGPHGDYAPIFDLILRKRDRLSIERFVFKINFTPVKTKGGYGELTFSVDSWGVLWETWGQGYIQQGIPLVIEPKYDGFRMIAYKENGKTKMTTEDTDYDLDEMLLDIQKDILSLSGDFILDGELELYADEEIKDKTNFDYKKGDKIERIDMKSFLKKEPVGKYTGVYRVFDIVYLNKEELFDIPFIERREILENLVKKDKESLKLSKALLVKTKDQFEKAIKWASNYPYSEGAMVKSSQFLYPKKVGRTSDIAKLKNYKEIVGKVVKKEKTKGGAYIYTIVLKEGDIIGRTYATKLEAKEGDILEVRVTEVKYLDGKLSWDNPIVHSIKPKGTALTTLEQAKSLAKARRRAEVFILKPFNFPGGKSQFLDILLKKIPPHKIYVEPYLGSGTLFWAKEPAEKSILSDTDKEIYEFFKFLKTASDADFAWLREQKWTYSESYFNKLLKATPTSLRAKAHKFKYLSIFSNRGARQYLNRAKEIEKRSSKIFLANLENYRELLKNAVILNEDALKVMKRYDSPDTFQYLDPPWKPIVSKEEWKGFDGEKFKEVVSSLKSKVLISYQGKLKLENFNKYTFTKHQKGLSKPTSQSLYWNYSSEDRIEKSEVKGEEIDTRSERAEAFWKKNWSNCYPKLKKPEFILHQHFRGLLETETGSFIVDYELSDKDMIIWLYDKALIECLDCKQPQFRLNGLSFEELMEQPDLLKTKHSIHADLRFQIDKSSLFGWTIFYGTTDETRKVGGDRLLALKENESLQCAPKLAQPIGWLYVSREKPYISKPSQIGATSKRFAKFFAIDWGEYEPGTWHRHFFEFDMKGKKLKGRLLIVSAPVGDVERKWICKRPKDQTWYADKNSLEEVIKDLKKRDHNLLIWHPKEENARIIKL